MSDPSETVLVLAPRGRDSILAVQLIQRHGLQATSMQTVGDVITRVLDAGCAVIAAEALTAESREQLAAALHAQPAWADLPIILFAPRGLERNDDALEAVKVLGNVSILERPVHSGALISALVAALRGRRRQYQARDAIHRRDQFLAMLGHELRNPLAAIMLAIETVPAGKPGDPFVRQRAIIERQSRHLARLVDDLLDVARVTSGKVRLHLEPLDLNEVADRCVQGAELAAHSRRIDLRTELATQALPIDGDLVRIEEILNNLITNALKYSPPGARVTVRTRRERSHCVVEVADTGIGIAPEVVDRVFDLFAQADASLDRSHGGLGIGLTLVKSLVQLHGGTIAARSPGLGQGSTFVIEIPVSRHAPRSAAHSHLVAVQAPRACRVLLVEDNLDLLEMTRDLLETCGCEVTCAADGAEGLARLLELRPEVAFIDIGIPRLDGYDVASQARGLGVTSYLVAMTGYGQPEDQRRAMDAGFDRHLTKPVTGASLKDVLATAAAKAGRSIRTA